MKKKVSENELRVRVRRTTEQMKTTEYLIDEIEKILDTKIDVFGGELSRDKEADLEVRLDELNSKLKKQKSRILKYEKELIVKETK